jgi:hypothetical protein
VAAFDNCPVGIRGDCCISVFEIPSVDKRQYCIILGTRQCM